MATISDRQQNILQAIVDEHTLSAEPVSSQFLEEEYDFGIRGAMIRREMQELADQGYLSQPHISAGRIPTDKGYRLAVDAILREYTEDVRTASPEEMFSFGEEDTVRVMYWLVRQIAQASSAFAFGHLASTKISWKEGWEEILRQPEFADTKYVGKFAEFLAALEEDIEDLEITDPLSVFIGKEHPFAKNCEFSTLLASCPFSKEETGLLALVGPVRMPYERNIRILESLPAFINSYGYETGKRTSAK